MQVASPPPPRQGIILEVLLLLEVLLEVLLLLTDVILEGVLHPFIDFVGEELLATADIAKNPPGMRDQVPWWGLEHHSDRVWARCVYRHVSIARDLELYELFRGRACGMLLGEHLDVARHSLLHKCRGAPKMRWMHSSWDFTSVIDCKLNHRSTAEPVP